jgi:hypothetical protein
MIPKIGAAALAIALLGAGSLLPADPDGAFSAARDAWPVASYPRYATYSTVISYHLGAQPGIRTWRTVEDLQRRVVHADGVSDQEAANPYVPHGINIGVGGFGDTRNEGGAGSLPSGIQQPGSAPPTGMTLNPTKTDDPFGMLTFAVNQDYGISRRSPLITASNDASDVGAPPPALPRIGGTGAELKNYAVTSLGTTNENGVALVHLALNPIHDPKKNRLRELWLNPITELPEHAIVAGVGNHAPLDSVNWKVDYTTVDGVPYIDRETALSPISTDNGEATDVTITFVGLKTTHFPGPSAQVGFSQDQGTTDP